MIEVFLILGLGAFWVLFMACVRVDQGRVHAPLFLSMIAAAKRLGMGEIAILSEPRAPKGMVYILEKQNLLDSLHLRGQAVDIALTREMAERYFGALNIAQWAYEIRFADTFNPRSHAVIKNITDTGD